MMTSVCAGQVLSLQSSLSCAIIVSHMLVKHSMSAQGHVPAVNTHITQHVLVMIQIWLQLRSVSHRRDAVTEWAIGCGHVCSSQTSNVSTSGLAASIH